MEDNSFEPINRMTSCNPIEWTKLLHSEIQQVTCSLKMFYEIELESRSAKQEESIKALQRALKASEKREKNLTECVSQLKNQIQQQRMANDAQVLIMQQKHTSSFELLRFEMQKKMRSYREQISEMTFMHYELLERLSESSISFPFSKEFRNHNKLQALTTQSIEQSTEIEKLKSELKLLVESNSAMRLKKKSLKKKVDLFENLSNQLSARISEKDIIIKSMQSSIEEQQNRQKWLEFIDTILKCLSEKDKLVGDSLVVVAECENSIGLMRREFLLQTRKINSLNETSAISIKQLGTQLEAEQAKRIDVQAQKDASEQRWQRKHFDMIQKYDSIIKNFESSSKGSQSFLKSQLDIQKKHYEKVLLNWNERDQSVNSSSDSSLIISKLHARIGEIISLNIALTEEKSKLQDECKFIQGQLDQAQEDISEARNLIAEAEEKRLTSKLSFEAKIIKLESLLLDSRKSFSVGIISKGGSTTPLKNEKNQRSHSQGEFVSKHNSEGGGGEGEEHFPMKKKNISIPIRITKKDKQLNLNAVRQQLTGKFLLNYYQEEAFQLSEGHSHQGTGAENVLCSSETWHWVFDFCQEQFGKLQREFQNVLASLEQQELKEGMALKLTRIIEKIILSGFNERLQLSMDLAKSEREKIEQQKFILEIKQEKDKNEANLAAISELAMQLSNRRVKSAEEESEFFLQQEEQKVKEKLQGQYERLLNVEIEANAVFVTQMNARFKEMIRLHREEINEITKNSRIDVTQQASTIDHDDYSTRNHHIKIEKQASMPSNIRQNTEGRTIYDAQISALVRGMQEMNRKTKQNWIRNSASSIYQAPPAIRFSGDEKQGMFRVSGGIENKDGMQLICNSMNGSLILRGEEMKKKQNVAFQTRLMNRRKLRSISSTYDVNDTNADIAHADVGEKAYQKLPINGIIYSNKESMEQISIIPKQSARERTDDTFRYIQSHQQNQQQQQPSQQSLQHQQEKVHQQFKYFSNESNIRRPVIRLSKLDGVYTGNKQLNQSVSSIPIAEVS